MSMIDTPLMRGLERVLDQSAFRHQVIATNLANIDTPNYRARDVRPLRFQVAVQFLKAEFHRLASAITGGGSTS